MCIDVRLGHLRVVFQGRTWGPRAGIAPGAIFLESLELVHQDIHSLLFELDWTVLPDPQVLCLDLEVMIEMDV